MPILSRRKFLGVAFPAIATSAVCTQIVSQPKARPEKLEAEQVWKNQGGYRYIVIDVYPYRDIAGQTVELACVFWCMPVGMIKGHVCANSWATDTYLGTLADLAGVQP